MGLNDYLQQNRMFQPGEAAIVRKRAYLTEGSFPISDPVVDQEWGRSARNTRTFNSYYDYFFSGQDIKVQIHGISPEDSQFGMLPIVEFAFNIEQEKMPVYGFWSHTFSAVCRGTRLITGAFSIVTKRPNYMTELLQLAAKNRSEAYTNAGMSKGITEDDRNIQTYWGKNLDPAVSYLGNQIFSIHPPFNISIIYGVQSVSAAQSIQPNYEAAYQEYFEDKDNAMFTDENHRLVEAAPDNSYRIVLHAVELKSVQRQFTSDGSPCIETYTFFARDVYQPPSNPGGVANSVTPPGVM
ncbi:MAG TPA: hypothetical protein VJ742_12220 [Nitrososphaera sp.]|nr:hypothetical protein [Nitrososphaera sp.]